jgi:two-component system, OmpR family, sensor histidine kinase BaeS
LEGNRLRYSLRTKLSFSYILIILICVAIISFSSNFLLERQFRNYVIEQHEQETKEVVSLINQRYISAGDWDTAYLDTIGMNALENGMIIKVKDDSGFTIWDATVHNDGLCQDMLTTMRQNMRDYYNESEGGYVENSYVLTENSNTFGSVIVGFYGPYFYTDSDIFFLNNINTLLIWAGVISVALALILGIIMSNQLSKPISRVIEKAGMISKGLFGEKIEEKSKTKEISLLADTINNLSETLQKQQNFSRQTSLDIAHELRTPLTVVQGNLEAVIDGIMELDEHRIEVIYEEILRINRLVEDLGKLAHYESENFNLNKSTFDISQLVKRIIKTFESDFLKENKKLIFNGDTEEIYADKDKISQVLINLISNALKFTKENGKVEISIVGNNDSTDIIIKDNGIGIPNEDANNIFERFYRSEKSRSRNTGGAGIGLAIVKSIILAHDGKIKLNSELGTGSEFILSLPKARLKKTKNLSYNNE